MKILLTLSLGLTLWSGFAVAQAPHRSHGSSAAQREAALSQSTRKMAEFQVSVIPLDPSKTIVSVQVQNASGQVILPGSIPLEFAYVAQNVPFTNLATTISGTQFVGHIPETLQGSYTVRVTMRWNGNQYQHRFFINRGNNKIMGQ